MSAASKTNVELDAKVIELDRERAAREAVGVSLDDFLAYMPQHSYIFAPSRELWPAASVNARLPVIVGPDGTEQRPAKWLDQNSTR